MGMVLVAFFASNGVGPPEVTITDVQPVWTFDAKFRFIERIAGTFD
jgi:hypothetical protein